MQTDATLLNDYARNRSEAAFAELVRRHVNFVYAAALRQVNGDTHLAKDVTQAVFTDLARKAPELVRHPVLTGWLFTSTRYAAGKQIRGEQRRRAREQEAQLMTNDAAAPGENLDWDRVRPVLDEALAELNDRDRRAILLRCLQDLDFASVGAQLELSDNAARMCVDRALDKLRDVLARRGIRSTTAALAVALATQAAVATPAGLASFVTGAALAGAATGGGFLAFMSLTKLQLGIAGAIVMAGGGIALQQERTNAQLRTELATLPAASVATEIERLREKTADLTRAAAQAKTLEVSEAEWTKLRAEAIALQDQLERDARQTRAAEVEASQRAVREALPISQLDVQPRILAQNAPAYPYELNQAKIEGSVLVEFVVDGEGVVRDAKVVRSTNLEFEAPTLTAVAKWKFAPGKKQGRNVSTRVSQMFQYVPTGQDGATRANWF